MRKGPLEGESPWAPPGWNKPGQRIGCRASCDGASAPEQGRQDGFGRFARTRLAPRLGRRGGQARCAQAPREQNLRKGHRLARVWQRTEQVRASATAGRRAGRTSNGEPLAVTATGRCSARWSRRQDGARAARPKGRGECRTKSGTPQGQAARSKGRMTARSHDRRMHSRTPQGDGQPDMPIRSAPCHRMPRQPQPTLRFGTVPRQASSLDGTLSAARDGLGRRSQRLRNGSRIGHDLQRQRPWRGCALASSRSHATRRPP